MPCQIKKLVRPWGPGPKPSRLEPMLRKKSSSVRAAKDTILRSESLVQFRAKISSEQSFAGKGLARMRFQITLEGKGFVFLFESAVKLDSPRTEFGRMRAAVLVMCEEPLFEGPGEPDIGLVRLVLTPDDIDVERRPCSVSLRSLLRSCNQLRRARLAKSRQNPHLRLFPAVSVACHA